MDSCGVGAAGRSAGVAEVCCGRLWNVGGGESAAWGRGGRYCLSMQDWVAVVGLRLFDPEATTTDVPGAVMNDPGLSLIARGLYAALLSYQGQPIDPYENAIDEDAESAEAIEELIGAGLAVRVARDARP